MKIFHNVDYLLVVVASIVCTSIMMSALKITTKTDRKDGP